MYRRRPHSDKAYFRRIMQTHATIIASTMSTPYRLSEYAFGYEKSNMTSESIATLCKAFNIADPWSTIANIASRCGLGQPTLKENFSNGMERRHAAAHNGDAKIEHSDLTDFAQTIRAVAIGFDVTLSTALGKMLTNDSAYLVDGEKITSRSSRISLVVLRKGMWAHVPEGATRARRRYADRADAITNSVVVCKPKGEALVVMGQNGMPMAWYTPYAD